MREHSGDHGGGNPHDRNPETLRPEEIESFVSRMEKHGFKIDYLGGNRFRIGDGPHAHSVLVIQIDTPGVTIVDVTEEFIRHYYATPRKATLKQLIIKALQESGIKKATDKGAGYKA